MHLIGMNNVLPTCLSQDNSTNFQELLVTVSSVSTANFAALSTFFYVYSTPAPIEQLHNLDRVLAPGSTMWLDLGSLTHVNAA